MTTNISHCQRAFTLVELLVVIAVIGVLVALPLPAVQAAPRYHRNSTIVLDNNPQPLNYELSNH